MIYGAVSETHAVASLADVIDAELFVGLTVGKKRCRVGMMVKLGAVAVFTKGSLSKIANVGDAAVGTEDVHFIEDVVAVVSCVAVETSVDTIDEQTSVGKTFIEHARIVTVLNDIILVRVAAGDFIGVSAVSFP